MALNEVVMHLSTCATAVDRSAMCTCGAASTRTEAEARASAKRYCEDCRWRKVSTSFPEDPGYDECSSPRNVSTPEAGTEFVRRTPGAPRKIATYCNSLRQEPVRDEPACGPDALWFAPKFNVDETARETADREGTHEADEEAAVQDECDRAVEGES